MAIKTVVCVICGETVTKRSTRSLRALGDRRTGRGCKEHPEVVALVRRKAQREPVRYERRQQKRREREADERFVRIEQGTTLVRAVSSLGNIDPESPYIALRNNGFTADEVEQVRSRVADRASMPLNSGERDLAAKFSAFWTREAS